MNDRPEPSVDSAPSGRRPFLKRERLVGAAAVLAFLGAFFGLGEFARSTPTIIAASPVTPGGGPVPFASWYWTMAVSPSDPSVLVLGTAKGIYRSADTGKSWQPTGPTGLNATSIVDDGSTLLAGGVTGSGAVPVVREGAGRVVANGKPWLGESTDSGSSWTQLRPSGLPGAPIQALAVDAAAKAVYALLSNGSLYRSADGAKSFTVVSAQIGIVPWALAITGSTHFVGGDMDVGPHVSTNGKGWLLTPYTDARGGHMVMEYAVQPTDSQTVLMTSVGIKISTDGGAHWRPSLTSSVMFGPVAWASSDPNAAYAVGFDGSLWVTSNAGKSWQKAG